MPLQLRLAILGIAALPNLHADELADYDERIAYREQVFVQSQIAIAQIVQAHSRVVRAAALESLQDARDQGTAFSSNQLGLLYVMGRYGIAPDVVAARQNFELGVSQNEQFSLENYGLMLYHGHLFARDEARGEELLTRAAQLGSRLAKAFLIDLLEQRGEAGDHRRAKAWFESMGMADDELVIGIDGDLARRKSDQAIGQTLLSAHYRIGHILPRDPNLADAWSAKIDPDEALLAMGDAASVYASTRHVRSDQKFALTLFEIALDSDDPTIINNLAWLLATAIDDAVRDGNRAVKLMQSLLDEDDERSYMIDTLAAAYAEAGDFDAAIETQNWAIGLLEQRSVDAQVENEHLNAYVEGKPWRE